MFIKAPYSLFQGNPPTERIDWCNNQRNSKQQIEQSHPAALYVRLRGLGGFKQLE